MLMPALVDTITLLPGMRPLCDLIASERVTIIKGRQMFNAFGPARRIRHMPLSIREASADTAASSPTFGPLAHLINTEGVALAIETTPEDPIVERAKGKRPRGRLIPPAHCHV